MKYLFLFSNNFSPYHKCGVESIIAAGIAGAASLTGSAMSSAGAKDRNAESMNFSASESEKARQWQEKMYSQQVNDQVAAESRSNEEWRKRQELSKLQTKELTDWIYKNYQSPSAQAKAFRAAGFNPAMMLSGADGGMSPASVGDSSPASFSAPGVGGASMQSAPALENELAAYSTLLDSASSSFDKMLSGRKTAEETERLQRSQDIYVNSLLAEMQLKQTSLAREKFFYQLDQLNLPKKQVAEIRKIDNEATLAFLRGDTEKAVASMTKAQELLIDWQAKNEKIRNANLPALYQSILNNATAEIALKQQMAKTEKTKQGLNRATSVYYQALSSTENALREGKVELQSLQNDLLTIDKFIRGNDLSYSDATNNARIMGTLEIMKREGFITQKAYEEAYQASVASDWAGRQQFVNYVGAIIHSFSEASNAFTSFRGMQLQNLRGVERNKIRERFNDIYESKVGKMQDKSSNPPVTGSYFDHIPPEHRSYYENLGY